MPHDYRRRPQEERKNPGCKSLKVALTLRKGSKREENNNGGIYFGKKILQHAALLFHFDTSKMRSKDIKTKMWDREMMSYEKNIYKVVSMLAHSLSLYSFKIQSLERHNDDNLWDLIKFWGKS